MMLTEGQMSDHKGAVLMFDALPNAKELLGDKGYDSDWFRAALTARGIKPIILKADAAGVLARRIMKQKVAREAAGANEAVQEAAE